MKSVFILRAGWNYEGATEVKAYASKSDADSAAQICYEYHDTRPTDPGIDGSEESWKSYMDVINKWRDDHPAGSSGGDADFFDVVEIEFVPHRAAIQARSKQSDVG